MKKSLMEKYGAWAIVTGSSTGIGGGFARQLAKQGFNLVLIARNEGKLKTMQSAIQNQFAVDVQVISADLTRDDSVQQIAALSSDLDIGLLVNNAGAGIPGNFLDNDIDEELKVIDLNVRAVVALSHLFGKRFANQHRGAIINVSSMVAHQGVPGFANYTGTKAFDLLFSESLEHELKPHGVDVLALLPGPTATDITATWDLSAFPSKTRSPDYVALTALRALGHKSIAIPGLDNQLMMFSTRFTPRRLLTAVMARVMRKVLKPITVNDAANVTLPIKQL